MNDVNEPYDMLQIPPRHLDPLDELHVRRDRPARDAHDKKELMPTGIFRDEERADYGDLYRQKIARPPRNGALEHRSQCL
jgi:hypothetical protein